MLHHYPKRVSVGLLVATLVVAAFPVYGELLFGNQYNFMQEKLVTILIFALFAVSLDLLVGVVGLVSLGHALFFGLGAYTLALASPDFAPASIWWMLPLVVAICASVAFIVGLLVVRTKGIFFIMTTLAFGQMLYHWVSKSRATGGTDGMFIMFRPSVEIGDSALLNLDNANTFFYVCLVLLILGYVFVRWLTRSHFGQVLDGIHDNEQRMRALGYSTYWYKVITFVIAGVMAGIAGMLAGMQYGYATPGLVDWHMSGEVLMMVILGGMGTIFGAIIGAFTYEILQFTFESLTGYWKLLMGLTIIAAVLVLPRGLAGLFTGPPRGDERNAPNALRHWLKQRRGEKTVKATQEEQL